MTLTIDDQALDVGRTTVGLQWKREWNDPGQPSSYVVYRCIPPAAMERIAAVVAGRKFIDPNCKPSTTYEYKVAAIGLQQPEDDTVTVTTRPPTEFPDADAFFDSYLSRIFARDPRDSTLRWCPQWRQHPEVVEVVAALWRAYEAHRPPDDPLVPSTERAVWLNVFAYPLMAHLWSQTGGLKDCSQNPELRHHVDPDFPPLAG